MPNNGAWNALLLPEVAGNHANLTCKNIKRRKTRPPELVFQNPARGRLDRVELGGFCGIWKLEPGYGTQLSILSIHWFGLENETLLGWQRNANANIRAALEATSKTKCGATKVARRGAARKAGAAK